MDLGIAGKKVLLTGGTKGIGRGIALAFAAAGAQVVTCSRHDDEAAQSLAIELKATGGEHHVMVADVSTESGVATLVDVAVARMGGVDVVIGCAGTITHIPFAKLSLSDWNDVVGSNLTANYLLVSQTLPLLGAGSSVILIGSRSALVGIPLRAHYTAAKAGLVGFMRSLAKELGPQGIRVNVIAPGVIEPEDRPLPEEIRARYHKLTSLGRLGRPNEIAGAALFLASDLSGYVTGETLDVDGGI